MPLYDFSCQGCNITSEQFVDSADESILCPLCSNRMSRAFPLIGTHIWKANPEGSGAKKASHYDKDKKAAKKERVDAITNKQLKSVT